LALILNNKVLQLPKMAMNSGQTGLHSEMRMHKVLALLEILGSKTAQPLINFLKHTNNKIKMPTPRT